MPSQSLELYLGDYIALFPVQYCVGDDKEGCEDIIRSYIDDDSLLFDNRPYKAVGYPVVVKGGIAYLVPSVKSFESLVGCGTLSG
ncbi:MAG: hypothetical protein KKD39_05740 [Candidatus Altiarchaeota archaeon]|nr:hypothetical protein [Candidatus Altiarchaeota archaeon]